LLPLPKLATEPFLKLWEQEVFALVLAEGKACPVLTGFALNGHTGPGTLRPSRRSKCLSVSF